MDKLICRISPSASVSGKIQSSKTVTGRLNTFGGNYPDYTGEYMVIPTVEGLSLDTSLKIMRDDVVVKPIPYLEVTNISGGKTATIG